MKIAIITPILSHYRLGLYKTLDATSRLKFIHYADPHDPRHGVKSLHPREVNRFRPLKNKTFGRATWQIGALSAALNKEFDAYIFTGDASFLSTWIAAGIARCRRAQVYFWTIGWKRPDKGLKRLTRLAFYRLANQLLVYSPRGKHLGIQAGYPSERITVIYNSVTQIAEAHHGMSKVVDNTAWTLGAVARLTSSKNFSLLIDAAEVLQRGGQPVNILFAGEGPERSNLQSKASALGVDCRFLGQIYHQDEIRAFYEQLTVTVIPAATGLTAIQSLAYGRPVVTNDDMETHGPEVAAVIEGVTGSLYQKDDLFQLVQRISHWAIRMSEEAEVVATACKSEVTDRWSFKTQANLILEAISRGA